MSGTERHQSPAMQAIQSEYSGNLPLTLLIERYQDLYHQGQRHLRLMNNSPVYEMPNAVLASHPSTRWWMECEKQLTILAKEITFSCRMLDMEVPEEVDDVDTFLENITRTNRPHRSVNRGEA